MRDVRIAFEPRTLFLIGVAVVAVLGLGALGTGSVAVAQSDAPSVWDGVFTEDQAQRGRGHFLQHCSRCHGANLEGGSVARALTGDTFWNDWRENTVDVLLNRISTNMPYSMDGSLEGSLPERTYVEIVAHLLERNGFPAGADALTTASSVGVMIITEDGPGELPAGTLVNIVGCLARSEEGSWRVAQARPPVRAEGDDPESHASLPLGEEEFGLMFVLTPLDSMEGHRVRARGLLIGEGGADGLNLSGVDSLSEACR